MALISCKDCKKEFSTDAPRCPHCGAKKSKNSGCLYVILIFIVLAILGLIGSGENNKTGKTSISTTSSLLPGKAMLLKGDVICATENEAQELISALASHDDQALNYLVGHGGCIISSYDRPITITEVNVWHGTVHFYEYSDDGNSRIDGWTLSDRIKQDTSQK